MESVSSGQLEKHEKLIYHEPRLKYSNGSLAQNKSQVTHCIGEKCGQDAVFYEIFEDKLYLMIFDGTSKEEDFLINERINFRTKTNQCTKYSRFNYFSLKEHRDFRYLGFHKDFGPFNLATTHLFLSWTKIFFDTATVRTDNVLIIVTNNKPETRLNVTYLVAVAALVHLKLQPKDILKSLKFYLYDCTKSHVPPMVSQKNRKFNDVSGNSSRFHLTLTNCLDAWKLALEKKFYDYYEFDHSEYLFCEQVQCGDLNWIVPNKILAFCGPSSENIVTEFTYRHTPDFYYNYFKDYNVDTIIRLNDKEYEASSFKRLGFNHFDLIFEDGSSPPSHICTKFINIVDKAEGAVAVHCAAGLGRTGTLIGAYLINRYGFDAETAIAWIRICRPGSVIGNQQDWLIFYYEKYISRSMPYAPQTTGARTTKNSLKTRITENQEDNLFIENSTTNQEAEEVTIYSITSAQHGQAQGLLKTKAQRSKKDKKTYDVTKTTKDLFAYEELSVSDQKFQNKHGQKFINNNMKNDCCNSRIQNVDSPMRKIQKTRKQEEILDLGKTLPIMFHKRDFHQIKKPNDCIDYYEISEAPDNELGLEATEACYRSWKVKFPKNTYFSIMLDPHCITKLQQEIHDSTSESATSLEIGYVLPMYCWMTGSLIKALKVSEQNLSHEEEDRYSNFKQISKPMPGQGGTLIYEISEFI